MIGKSVVANSKPAGKPETLTGAEGPSRHMEAEYRIETPLWHMDFGGGDCCGCFHVVPHGKRSVPLHRVRFQVSRD